MSLTILVIETVELEQLSIDSDSNTPWPVVVKEIEKLVPKNVIIVEIMSAACRVLWEEQYDASQGKTTSFLHSMRKHYGTSTARVEE